MRRIPLASCPFCFSRDLIWNPDRARWECTICDGKVVKPTAGVADWHVWYVSRMDNYESAREMRDKLDEFTPQSQRDKLVHAARQRKVSAEYQKAEEEANIATLLKEVIDSYPIGDVYLKIPELELEVRFKW